MNKGSYAKDVFIGMIARSVLAMVVVLPLLSWGEIVGAKAKVRVPGEDNSTLTKQLVEAVRRGDVALAKTLLNRGQTRTLRNRTKSPLFWLLGAATWSW